MLIHFQRISSVVHHPSILRNSLYCVHHHSPLGPELGLFDDDKEYGLVFCKRIVLDSFAIENGLVDINFANGQFFFYNFRVLSCYVKNKKLHKAAVCLNTSEFMESDSKNNQLNK